MVGGVGQRANCTKSIVFVHRIKCVCICLSGQADEQYFGGTAIGTNANGIDAGQQSLLEAGALRSDQDAGGSGRAEDGQGRTVWCGCLSLRFYQQVCRGLLFLPSSPAIIWILPVLIDGQQARQLIIEASF